VQTGNVIALAAVVGAVVGAWLPLTAYRLAVPAAEPVRATCGECGAALPGWARLPARCGRCRAWWGPRPWYTAAVSAAACALVGWAAAGDAALPMFAGLALLGVLLGAIDLACKRLPHLLVVPAIWVSVPLFAMVAAFTGQWGDLLRMGLGAVVFGATYLLLYLLPGHGLGFGDVKLAVLLGGYLGWLGWGEVLLGALLPWLVNSPVVLGLLLAGRINRKSSLPFGPAMLMGGLLATLASTWMA
jgi:leader peptidase (prepilin peptidase)/N-methyltransferase